MLDIELSRYLLKFLLNPSFPDFCFLKIMNKQLNVSNAFSAFIEILMFFSFNVNMVNCTVFIFCHYYQFCFFIIPVFYYYQFISFGTQIYNLINNFPQLMILCHHLTISPLLYHFTYFYFHYPQLYSISSTHTFTLMYLLYILIQ